MRDCAGLAMTIASHMPPPLPIQSRICPTLPIGVLPPISSPVTQCRRHLLIHEAHLLRARSPSVVPLPPLSCNHLHHGLLAAMARRRAMWTEIIQELPVEVLKSFLAKLISCSARIAVQERPALLVRLVDLVPRARGRSRRGSLLKLVVALGGRVEGDDNSTRRAPTSGEPVVALGRLAVVLLALVTQPRAAPCCAPRMALCLAMF